VESRIYQEEREIAVRVFYKCYQKKIPEEEERKTIHSIPEKKKKDLVVSNALAEEGNIEIFLVSRFERKGGGIFGLA